MALALSRRAVRATIALSAFALALLGGRAEAAGGSDLTRRLDVSGVEAGEVVFPKGASQGPGSWYLGEFRIQLQIPPGETSGSFELEASVAGYSSNYVRVRLVQGGHCGDRTLIVESVDLLKGRWRRVLCGPRVVITSRNFLQDRAVRTGRSGYRVASDGLRALGLEATSLGGGIHSSSLGPGMLTLSAVREGGRVEAGVWERVPVALVNTGDRPLRRFLGRVSVDGAAARPELVALPAVLPPHSRHLSYFWVRVPRQGAYRVTVTASSSANSPAAEFELAAGPRESSSLSSGLRRFALICAALSVACFIGVSVVSRARAAPRR